MDVARAASSVVRSKERVLRICAAGGADRTLRSLLLDELRQSVGFDAYAWLLTDPETSVGTTPLAEVPCLPELPRLIRLKYLTSVNRWTSIGDSAVVSLREQTGDDLAQSLIWRELLRGYGIGDVASCVFRDRFGCWGFLDLWRSGTDARFTAAEAGFLADIAGPVTAALRQSQADTFLARAEHPLRQPGPVVLLLSPALDVLGQTPETRAYLERLVPPAHGASPIPASAYNVAAQLLAVEAGVDQNQPSARVHLGDGRWVTLRAARIGGEDPVQERNIAVPIEASSPTERIDLYARAFALSPREGELLTHLMTGTDTRELARRMFLSEHTVQDHLKSIFEKTSAHNRRSLLSQALGT